MKEIIILADGEFPEHEIPLTKLKESSTIICCDGAAQQLDNSGMVPFAIVGDLDSLDSGLKKKYSHILYYDSCQETNDLTKAFRFACDLKPESIIILGATGKREDHTIGNISLLAEYAAQDTPNVQMWTNSGIFRVISQSGTYSSVRGTPISFFTLDPYTKIKSKGLKYPLDKVVFDNWWKATLNECTGSEFHLEIYSVSPVIVFISY